MSGGSAQAIFEFLNKIWDKLGKKLEELEGTEASRGSTGSGESVVIRKPSVCAVLAFTPRKYLSSDKFQERVSKRASKTYTEFSNLREEELLGAIYDEEIDFFKRDVWEDIVERGYMSAYYRYSEKPWRFMVVKLYKTAISVQAIGRVEVDVVDRKFRAWLSELAGEVDRCMREHGPKLKIIKCRSYILTFIDNPDFCGKARGLESATSEPAGSSRQKRRKVRRKRKQKMEETLEMIRKEHEIKATKRIYERSIRYLLEPESPDEPVWIDLEDLHPSRDFWASFYLKYGVLLPCGKLEEKKKITSLYSIGSDIERTLAHYCTIGSLLVELQNLYRECCDLLANFKKYGDIRFIMSKYGDLKNKYHKLMDRFASFQVVLSEALHPEHVLILDQLARYVGVSYLQWHFTTKQLIVNDVLFRIWTWIREVRGQLR